jgi:hypothetical protein
MKNRDRAKSQAEGNCLDQSGRSDVRQGKEWLDHAGQERLAKPAKTQAG